MPTRRGPVLAVAAILFVASALGAWRYLTHHPLETNLRNMASTNAELDRGVALMDKFDRAFGHGISGGFALAVKSRDEVAPLVRKLRAADEGKPERQRLFSRVTTLDDRLPADQPEKLEILAELRRLIDRQLRHPDVLSDDERKTLRGVASPRQPARRSATPTSPSSSPGLTSSGTAPAGGSSSPTPASASTPGTRAICGGSPRAVRGLGLGPDVLVGGSAFVFTDMLNAMERDGPRATAIAALGAIVVVVALLGPSLAASATLFCGAFGTLALIALAGLFGLKVNFLDFVALPITIGIGIDYSVNIISRARTEPDTPQGRVESARTASAVALCSYTTVVGYGSLWFSSNKGIRSFGFAAMLGEAHLPERGAPDRAGPGAHDRDPPSERRRRQRETTAARTRGQAVRSLGASVEEARPSSKPAAISGTQ